METKINSRGAPEVSTRIREDSETAPDITGALLPDGFRVINRLDFRSGEADIYECSRNSREQLLLKYYRRTNAIKESVLRKLRDIRSPFVAPVYAAGVYEGHQYVIMPWYRRRSLAFELAAGKRFAFQDLKSRIIPSVNEALRVIHAAGIIHRDLKPANLIPDDDGQRILVIDFGISSDTDGRTLVRTSTGMTPLYAAPEAVQGIYHRESDYYSLGITVFELFAGFTPFQNAGLSPEESARLAAVNKISFPDNFPGELRDLVLGLTYRDISGRNDRDNPNRRWGYPEVSAWLKGEKQPVPGEYAQKTPPEFAGFPPYLFNGIKYPDSGSFVRALLADPEPGLRELGRGIISHHYSLYDEAKAALARRAEEALANSPAQAYGIFCSLMYHLDPSVKELYADGRGYGSMADLARDLLKEANAGGDTRLINHGASLFRTDFLAYYAAEIVKSPSLGEILSRLRRITGRRDLSDREIACILGWSFSGERSFRAGSSVYQSPEDFRSKMQHLLECDPSGYARCIAAAAKDLLFASEFLPDRNAAAIIKKALNASPPARDNPGDPEKTNTASEGGKGRRHGGAVIIAALLLAGAAAVFWQHHSVGEACQDCVLPRIPESGMRGDPAPKESPNLSGAESPGAGSQRSRYLSRGFALEKKNEKALALRNFEEACRLKSSKGCARAGWYYQNGSGTPQDYGRARELYELSCGMNDGMGCSNLGWLYQQGLGVSRDYARSLEYYRKGCDLDNGHSCAGLGYLHRYGLGTAKNRTKARSFFARACQLGHRKSCSLAQE